MKTKKKSKPKNKKKEITSPKKEATSPKNESFSPKKGIMTPKSSKKRVIEKAISSDKFPKNANEFKHIMDDINCGVPDIEYMLQLRRHKKIAHLNKNLPLNTPSFYDDDLQKYKKKLFRKVDEQRLLKTNIGRFRQIFSDRSRYAINDSQYKYEVLLRSDNFNSQHNITRNPDTNNKQKIEYSIKNKNSWHTPVIPRSKSLFDTMLPPVLMRSKEIFNKLEDKISRPILKLNKDGFINGEKVRRRVFEYNKNVALRYPSEHFPSSKYKNDYGYQNVGLFQHLLNFDNRTMTSNWSTHLRNPQKIKLLPDDIKKRERKLKERTNEQTYPKN